MSGRTGGYPWGYGPQNWGGLLVEYPLGLACGYAVKYCLPSLRSGSGELKLLTSVYIATQAIFFLGSRLFYRVSTGKNSASRPVHFYSRFLPFTGLSILATGAITELSRNKLAFVFGGVAPAGSAAIFYSAMVVAKGIAAAVYTLVFRRQLSEIDTSGLEDGTFQLLQEALKGEGGLTQKQLRRLHYRLAGQTGKELIQDAWEYSKVGLEQFVTHTQSVPKYWEGATAPQKCQILQKLAGFKILHCLKNTGLFLTAHDAKSLNFGTKSFGFALAAITHNFSRDHSNREFQVEIAAIAAYYERLQYPEGTMNETDMLVRVLSKIEDPAPWVLAWVRNFLHTKERVGETLIQSIIACFTMKGIFVLKPEEFSDCNSLGAKICNRVLHHSPPLNPSSTTSANSDHE